MPTHTHTRPPIYIYIYIYAPVYKCNVIYAHTSQYVAFNIIYLHLYVPTYIYIYIYACVRVCVWVCVCEYACVCVSIYLRLCDNYIRTSNEIINVLHAFIYIGLAVRVFTNGPGDLGSIPGRVIPKTLKMELDTTLLNAQHYKVRFKGKVEQSREWSSALPYTLV